MATEANGHNYGLWFEGGGGFVAQWMKDNTGRVLLFTEEEGQAMRDLLQVGLEQIILKEYDGDGPTIERYVDLQVLAELDSNNK